MNSVVAWYEISNQPPFSALLYRDSRIQKIILKHVRPCSSLFFIGVGGGWLRSRTYLDDGCLLIMVVRLYTTCISSYVVTSLWRWFSPAWLGTLYLDFSWNQVHSVGSCRLNLFQVPTVHLVALKNFWTILSVLCPKVNRTEKQNKKAETTYRQP
jgi:hypothetical protein